MAIDFYASSSMYCAPMDEFIGFKMIKYQAKGLSKPLLMNLFAKDYQL